MFSKVGPSKNRANFEQQIRKIIRGLQAYGQRGSATHLFTKKWFGVDFGVHFGVQNRLINGSLPKQGGFWASWGPQGASRGHFWRILGGFWTPLGSILRAVWVILGLFWGSSSNKRSKKKRIKQKRNKQQPKLQQIAGNRSQHQQKATNIRNKQQLAANSIE